MCLASCNQETTPDGQLRASLQLAGLGEKKVTLLADSDGQDIYSELCFQFPSLRDGGGFELLRVPEGGKHLEVIVAPASGYTVPYLRAVVHHAKVFVRPMQQDLSLDPVQEEVILLNFW